MKATALLLAALGIGALYGCYSREDMSPAVVGAMDDAGMSSTLTGLPCDVAEVLERSCVSCHGTPTAGGAQTSLDTRAKLTAPYREASSLAAEALARMKGSTTAMMPPAGPVSTADLDVFSAWVEAGMPEGSCASVAPAPTPTVVCTSKTMWSRGDKGSDEMHPGLACIACHAKGGGDGDGDDDDDDDAQNNTRHDHDDAPLYTAAGTTYPTKYEPDDCYGTGTLLPKVVITGADGVVQTLSVNEAGNFFTKRSIAMPYTAKIVRGDQTRTMQTPQTNGDCNTCHIADTSDPTGRIVSP